MFGVEGGLFLVISLALFLIKGFALIDCVARRPADFTSYSALSKNAWLVILVLSLLAHAVNWNPLGLLNLLGTVGALVYLAQMRGSSH